MIHVEAEYSADEEGWEGVYIRPVPLATLEAGDDIAEFTFTFSRENGVPWNFDEGIWVDPNYFRDLSQIPLRPIRWSRGPR